MENINYLVGIPRLNLSDLMVERIKLMSPTYIEDDNKEIPDELIDLITRALQYLPGEPLLSPTSWGGINIYWEDLQVYLTLDMEDFDYNIGAGQPGWVVEWNSIINIPDCVKQLVNTIRPNLIQRKLYIASQ